ncbi:hypothetical protein ACQ4PT_037176 [Festuca glaucescens]
MDVSDLSSSSIEYNSGNTDEDELDFTSANENAPPEDEHTSGDDDVDESMDADGIDLEDDNVEQEEDVDTDNIRSDVVDEPNDDEKLDSGFVDEVLVGDNSSYDYYGDSDLETIEEPVRRRHVKSVGKKKNESKGEDESDAEDKRDFYWEVMEKTFVSEAAAYTFYNGYARQEGFSVRKFKFKKTKGAKKIVRRRRFVCSREGRRDSKLLTMDNRTRRLRPESRCNCKAELDVKLDRASGLWRVAKFVYKHSHKCAEPNESPFLRSHRRIKDFQKAEILALAAAGVRKHVIMDTFLSKGGLPARRKSDLYGWGFPIAEERQRFTELNVLQSEALQVACKDPELFEQTKAFYADLISKKMEYDNVPDRRTNSLNTDGNKVGDPAKVAARGAPKKRKRTDDGEGPVTKNGRPLSYDERGKGIRCSRCKKPGHTKRSLKCELHPRHVAHVFVGQEDQ